MSGALGGGGALLAQEGVHFLGCGRRWISYSPARADDLDLRSALHNRCRSALAHTLDGPGTVLDAAISIKPCKGSDGAIAARRGTASDPCSAGSSGRLDGSPALIGLDEAWALLDDPVFGPKIREWLKTLRRKNASVVFATQSLADVTESRIAPAILESCLARVFLPNARAIEPQSRAAYERLGLNARQIDTVARATPKRDYYFQSARGNRLFELGLGEVTLAFAGVSQAEDLKRLEAVQARAKGVSRPPGCAMAADWAAFRSRRAGCGSNFQVPRRRLWHGFTCSPAPRSTSLDQLASLGLPPVSTSRT